MISLTPEERASLSASGLISFPAAAVKPKPTKKAVRTRKTKPTPTPFTGTPNERARHAVDLAKTGLFSLCKCTAACGYHESASAALRELIAGGGPLTDICRRSIETGKINAQGSVNTASLRIIRDFYGLPNINGETAGSEELRNFLKTQKGKLPEIASYVWLHPETLRSFIRGRHGMKQAVMLRVWQAVKEMGLKTTSESK